MRTPPPLLDSYAARISTPFAVLGIRTAGDQLTGIEYLPKGAATLAPVNRLAERVCRQLEGYLDDPEYRFDLPAMAALGATWAMWSFLPGETVAEIRPFILRGPAGP